MGVGLRLAKPAGMLAAAGCTLLCAKQSEDTGCDAVSSNVNVVSLTAVLQLVAMSTRATLFGPLSNRLVSDSVSVLVIDRSLMLTIRLVMAPPSTPELTVILLSA
jgi:hypothetical protein